MNDRALMWKNMWRKPVRTSLLIVSITIAFLILCVMVSFNISISTFNTLPTRMVTLSKVNFTETLPIAHYDRIKQTPGVIAAAHMNWFGGYYQDQQQGFMAVFAITPADYFRVYSEDLRTVDPAQRKAFFDDRASLLVDEHIAQKYHWRVGQHVPLQSNIFTNKNTGNHTWDFTLAGLIPTPPGSSQSGSVLMHYDYYNETVTFGRDRIGWVAFLTQSQTINDRVAHAIDARFANSADETSTEDEATFNKSFAAQLGNISLVITLVVGAAFAAILLIVGTTMALAVRERTKEIGVMKTLGFSSGRVLRLILGESLLLSFFGAALGALLAAGMLYLLSQGNAGGPTVHFAPITAALSAAIALVLGLATGLAPAIGAYRMKIVDAFSRR